LPLYAKVPENAADPPLPSESDPENASPDKEAVAQVPDVMVRVIPGVVPAVIVTGAPVTAGAHV